MNSDENNDYVGSDTSVPSSSTIPLADPPAVVVIEATGLQRIWNVIVFAVATLHVVVIFVFYFYYTCSQKAPHRLPEPTWQSRLRLLPFLPLYILIRSIFFLHHLGQIDIIICFV